MKCTEKDCAGEIDLASPIGLRTSCFLSAFAYPCRRCGRLHWEDGKPVFNRQNHKAFLENRAVVHKSENGRIIA